MDIVVDLHGSTHSLFLQCWPHICRQWSSRPRGQTRRKEKVRQVPPRPPGPIRPRDHWTTWLPRPKFHQSPPGRYGPSTNSYPERLARHPNHAPQQHLQRTTPSPHHVAPGACSSPPPHAFLHGPHYPQQFTSRFVARLQCSVAQRGSGAWSLQTFGPAWSKFLKP